MTNGRSQGINAAQLGIRILRGESPTQIPVIEKSPNIPMLDYRVMQQLDLPLAKFSADTVFINEPTTFYSKHTRLIWITLSIFLIQILLISYLILNVQKRKQAEQGLKEQREQLKNRVDERTAELSLTNKELALEVDNRDKALQQERNLTQIIEKSLNEIYLFDADNYRFVFVNEGARTNTGYSQAEFLNMTPTDIKPEIDLSSFEKMVEPLKTGQKNKIVFETVHGRKDGSTYPIEAHLQKTEYRSRSVFAALIVDITERKKAEAAIRKGEEQWNRTFNSFTDLVTLQNTDLQIVKANQAACTILDLPLDEIISRHCYDLFAGSKEPCLNCPLLATRKTFAPYTREMYHEKLGKTFLVSGAPVFDKQGKLEYIAHVAKDITIWKQVEERLLVSEKMTSIAGLAAGVAHEINTPLSGILQSSQLITMGLDPDSTKNQEIAEKHGVDLSAVRSYFKDQELDYFMGGIKASAIKASKIIKGLLDFSRPHGGSFSATDLNKLMQDTLLLAQSDYDLKKQSDIINVKIIEEYSTDLPDINCVGMEIEQVLLNLIKNGVQAMAGEETTERCLILRTLKADEAVRIEVEDNGPGIDTETKKQIFNPFFTTKEVGSGTGLGLSVSYAIICKKHHGKIWVESRPGKGAKFIVELPLTQVAA